MLNFLKKKAAQFWAGNHVKKTRDFKLHAEARQEEQLLAMVRTAEKTLFGRQHHFEMPRKRVNFILVAFRGLRSADHAAADCIGRGN